MYFLNSVTILLPVSPRFDMPWFAFFSAFYDEVNQKNISKHPLYIPGIPVQNLSLCPVSISNFINIADCNDRPLPAEQNEIQAKTIKCLVPRCQAYSFPHIISISHYYYLPLSSLNTRRG